MNQNYYGFLIEKYGKWGITKKERVLILSQDGISYYPVPDDEEFHQNLIAFKREIKKTEIKNIQDLVQGENVNNDMKEKFPKEKKKGEILWKNLEEKMDEEGRVIFLDKTLDKDKRKSENKEWDCIVSLNEIELIKKIRADLNNTKGKSEKEENKNQKKADENQNNKNTSQSNQFTHYKFLQSLEDIYQILWEEYYKEKFNSSKKPEPGKLAELELSIKIVVNEFTKYCERLCQIILSYLKQQSFSERNVTKIIPIIFPSLLDSDTPDHYLIFHFFGITITMTWNVITYSNEDDERQTEILNAEKKGNINVNNQQINNDRKESKGMNSSNSNVGGGGQGMGNREDDIKVIYGTWDTLKATFKQIDYYQNGAPDNINDKSKVLRVPLTCLIDYCGFRFLCECELPGKMKNNDIQKFEPKREIGEKCKPEFYDKCLKIFNELFFCNTSKKGGTFQKNEDNYGSNRSYLDNNKNGQGIEKTPYDKLFDIVNDYFSKQDNTGENNIEQKSGPQNKSIFFQTQLRKLNQEANNNNANTTISVEYFNINYYEFNNLTEYPRQIAQENIFFNKKTYFRPELIPLSTGKDMNFGEQNFEHRNDKDNLENNKANDEQNQNKLGMFKEKYLNIFNNSLNSFYFKIYDSETMDNLFHSHGINLTSLGYVAEKSESPYVKEFAINEMIARTCKKILFSILATERMIPILHLIKHSPSVQNPPPPFKSSDLPYKYQKLYNKYENKSDQKDDLTTTSWTYFSFLKEITLNLSSTTVQEYKFFINLWDLKSTNQQKNNDEATRNEILNINSAEDKKNQKIIGENDGHNQNKKATTIIADDHIAGAKRLISNFLNVLFNKTNGKIKVKGRPMNHKELWRFIREEVGNYFEIESKEVLIFCKLNCMSLPPFLAALEYHTGIRLNWGKVKDERAENIESELPTSKLKDQDKRQNFFAQNSTGNYTNRHILNIVWKPEDVLEILPKTKTFSYNFFVSNDKEKNDEYICNYSQLIIDRNLSQVDNFDKFMLLRFFYEKINKINNFSLWYVIYFNELKYDSFVENMKENKDLKTEKEENSRDSDSNKDEKSKKNIISNKNNECIRLYKYIYEELKKNEALYRNTRYDLTGLLYHNEENNLDEEVNTNKNISYSSYMQKMFSRLGYIMLNLTKEILAIEQTNLKLPQDDDSLKNINNNLELNKNNSLVNMSGNELSPKKNNNQNSNKEIFTERKQLDGEEVLVHAETMLRFEIPFKYETYAIELIENFYIKDHPYYCDIKELCGKELLTRWKASHTNRRDIEEIIETYFKEAIQVGLKCLPITNIYLANISLDVGTFYAVRNDYLNAVKIYNWAYVPFKKNSQYFQKDYYMYLKRFIKYNIKLGDFRMAIALGEELLKEYQNFRNEKDTKTGDYLNKNLHMERIRYNLALVALKVKDYEKGLTHCQSIFENKDQLNSNNNNDNLSNSSNSKRRKTEYINWQKGKENDYPGSEFINQNMDNRDYEALLKDEEYKIKLKLYMKMIIRSLVQDNKKQYLQAILRFYDSPEEKESLKEPKNLSEEERKREKQKELNEIKLDLQGSGNLNEYFKSKILVSLKNKNRAEESTEKIQIKEKEQQNSDYELFKKLFKYFRDENVFYSFDKRDKFHKNKEEKEEEEKEENEEKNFENNEENKNDEEEEENEED